MHGLDLRALEIFRAVAREGGVSAAAARLHRVPSNVSTRVKQLEDQVGRPLFRRHRRGLTLTADGEILLDYAERLLRLSAEAAEALGDDRPRGELRIAAMESTAAARLPGPLAAYQARHPQVRVVLRIGTARAVLDALRGGEADVAFVAEPVAFDGIETRPVFRESLVLVVPAAFPPPDDPRGLAGRTVVAFEDGCAYRRYLQDWLLDAGIVPGQVMAVSSYLAIFACVAAGTGFAVVPRSVLDMVDAGGGFQRHPLPGPLADIRTLMAWRAGDRSAKVAALRNVLPPAPAPGG
ncbi:MAG: LysR family transcriptional regulator [Hyphomicrobiales bacterium]|nr:LysR family transcriptional regulator [Hyphomicrobiales bacterium]